MLQGVDFATIVFGKLAYLVVLRRREWRRRGSGKKRRRGRNKKVRGAHDHFIVSSR